MAQQNTLVVIPVRLAATRLPNKPLADIWGKPMIIHVWEKAVEAGIGPVVVACGDEEIVKVVHSFGGEAVLTDPSLASGTDRVKAAADLYDKEEKFPFVINIQGDLPTLDPSIIRHSLDPFVDPAVDITTLGTPIKDPHELTDPGTVKIALSMHDDGMIGRALYFSRNLIPSGEGAHYHHIGLYAFKRQALNKFVSLPINPLEVREKLEQLRALAHGMRIDVKIVDTEAPFGVDTQADLEKAIRIIGESYTG
ncbi:MAG: 3-deoxy-manno-octulosonate cytidylyltransferase [Alphaproteobacteria bacterium]|nr:3-deoxy-manno-octulosonate cytidylyltransferase [Alphaproteobacteria bacterium]